MSSLIVRHMYALPFSDASVELIKQYNRISYLNGLVCAHCSVNSDISGELSNYKIASYTLEMKTLGGLIKEA